MIDCYVICILDNPLSEASAARLAETIPSNAILHSFDAITPKRIGARSKRFQLVWNYPWSGSEIDLQSGLKKTAYPTAVKEKRIACFLSHHSLWEQCVRLQKPIIIHEHDARYINEDPLPLEMWEKSGFDIIGLNDPRGATRRWLDYHNAVAQAPHEIVRAPWIDEQTVPQGIAGNSSYWINPKGAQLMLDLTKEYGMWPNDALMCRQLVSKLGQSRRYWTYVQSMESTTSL